MNYLGHCLLTQHHPEYVSGNLSGDFFKGDLSKHTQTPQRILTGVEIHRFIDMTTDQAAEIKAVAHIFQKEGINRISFIASDILLDHFISKYWSNYSNQNIDEFIQSIYKYTRKDLNQLPIKFHSLFDLMEKNNWLKRYQTEKGIDLTFQNFSQRLPFENQLDQSLSVYLKHQKEIDELYKNFLTEIKPRVSIHFNIKSK